MQTAPRFRQGIHVGCWLLIILVAVGTLLGLAANVSWVFFYFDQPRIHYVVTALLVLSGSLIYRRVKMASVAGLVLITNLFLVASFLVPLDNMIGTKSFSVFHANLGRSHTVETRLVETIASCGPTIIFFQEVTPEFLVNAESTFDDYELAISEARKDSRGVAAFVQRDSLNRVVAKIVNFAADSTDRPTIELSLDSQLIRVLSFHTKRPHDSSSYAIQAAEYEELERWLKQSSAPTLAIGDFNAAPWSTRVRELVATLQTPQTGFRRHHATWPSSFGIFGVPIDLIVHTKGVEVTHSKAITLRNSDHRSVFAEVRME